MKNKQFILLLLTLVFCANVPAQNAKNITTGTQDRAFWVKTLYKIAYPVIHNLANSTLKVNMPLETAPNYGLNLKKVTYTEAFGRTLAGIAPWLELADDVRPNASV